MPRRRIAHERSRSGVRQSAAGASILRIAVFILFALAVAAGWVAWWAARPIDLAASVMEVYVSPGSSLRATLRQFDNAGVGISPWPFILLARIAGTEGSIKPGTYELRAPITPWGLLGKLSRGQVSQSEVVIPEGWTFRQLRARLDAHPDFLHDSANLSDTDILRRIGASEAHAEGLFFPDTYLVDKRSSDLDLLGRAYRAMREHLDAVWRARDPGLPLANPYEALVLASIIEKETGLHLDRPMIAAVFVNRLRRGMLLQTDPTVIYGLGAKFDGNLRKRDLTTDSAYNTYTRAGLPPTPISMPGLASLRAAVNPADSNALYFVARGDGSSEFSESLDGHNRAVNKFQKNLNPR